MRGTKVETQTTVYDNVIVVKGEDGFLIKLKKNQDDQWVIEKINAQVTPTDLTSSEDEKPTKKPKTTSKKPVKRPSRVFVGK
jgi:hypothetical protein